MGVWRYPFVGRDMRNARAKRRSDAAEAVNRSKKILEEIREPRTWVYRLASEWGNFRRFASGRQDTMSDASELKTARMVIQSRVHGRMELRLAYRRRFPNPFHPNCLR